MLLKNIFILFFVLGEIFIGFSQVTDDFSDNNFNTNPKWSGDTAEFKINTSKQLQLNSSVAGNTYLSTPDTVMYNAEWRFWVKLSFAPSDNNYIKIYLCSDQENLEGALNGYFIRMGENGSADGVDLWEQSGTAETKIIDGIAGHCAGTVNTLRIKVTRDSIGNWNLYSDTIGGSAFSLEGTALNTIHTSSSYMGISAKYTISNSTKFYFDDFYAGTQNIDKTKPVVDSVKVISANQLDIYFDEPIEPVSAQTIQNYNVSNAFGNPSAATIEIQKSNLVHLQFGVSFTSLLPYVIQISGVKDAAGNSMNTTNKSFIYIAPPSAGFKDVLINEVFADPSPVVGLPSAEFVEIYNKSNKTLNLKNWKLSDGTTSNGTIVNTTILPGEFLILCNMADTAAFKSFGKTSGCSSFPSLNNSGDALTLKNENGILIDSVDYTDGWYNDEVKKDGGWSLELINPKSNNTCLESSNWKTSIDAAGGTPGKQNSMYSIAPDTISPAITGIEIVDSTHLTICFSEEMNHSLISNKNNFSFSPALAFTITPASGNACTEIFLSNPLAPGVNYTLTLSNSSDCSGNILDNNIISFNYALPQYNDIVINEILFDPLVGGVEFIEIYNRSSFLYDLKNIDLCSWDTISNILLVQSSLGSPSSFLQPGEYICISKSNQVIKQQYSVPSNAGFTDLSNFPALNNSGDAIAITAKGILLDKFIFRPNMHYPLLNETKGVSLERINPNEQTQKNSNWHSAASSVGYSTPGYKNSQYAIAETSEEITISPEVFSPDNDGYNVVLSISYQLEKPGFSGTVFIYDSNGRLVKQLIKNELLSQKNIFTWNGITDKNEKAAIGIYIIWLEVLNPNGDIKQYKKSCVLGGRI